MHARRDLLICRKTDSYLDELGGSPSKSIDSRKGMSKRTPSRPDKETVHELHMSMKTQEYNHNPHLIHSWPAKYALKLYRETVVWNSVEENIRT